jgi:hypothetical protein
MATNLVAVGNQAPGFYGLNLQQSSVVLDPQWASEANNAVITSDGRIGARKGYSIVNTAVGDDITTGTIRTLHEYIDSSGNSDLIACANNAIFKADSPYTDFTSIYSTSITADNWQIQNFNSKTYFFQNGQAPLVYNGTAVSLLSAETSFGDSADAVIATVKPNCVHAAFGRLWVGGSTTPGYGTKIWWSDSLSGHIYNSGTAGALNLHSVMTGGTDYVTAISSFQNWLIIFLKNSILIYDGAEVDPANQLSLREHIKGIGCIARDSVRHIGTDLLFLSSTGVRSFSRVVNENGDGTAPINDISKNVRDYLSTFTFGENANYIKSLYNPKEGFYLLSFPTFDKVFCFDIRGMLPDNSARVTTWDLITPTAMVSMTNQDIYIGKANNVCSYSTYLDDTLPYTFTYSTPWLDYGQEFNQKIPKNFYLLTEAASGSDVSIAWATDFVESYNNVTKTTNSTSISYFNESEYNEDEYGYGYAISALQGPMSKSGKVVKFKVYLPIEGAFNIKKYEIYAKIGRVI